MSAGDRADSAVGIQGFDSNARRASGGPKPAAVIERRARCSYSFLDLEGGSDSGGLPAVLAWIQDAVGRGGIRGLQPPLMLADVVRVLGRPSDADYDEPAQQDVKYEGPLYDDPHRADFLRYGVQAVAYHREPCTALEFFVHARFEDAEFRPFIKAVDAHLTAEFGKAKRTGSCLRWLPESGGSVLRIQDEGSKIKLVISSEVLRV